MHIKIGLGYDVHRLGENHPLVLGGVEIPYDKGLLGHSDADVLVHAIIDALFGAIALGDIGSHFPDCDQKYLNIKSLELLKHAWNLVNVKGFKLGNLDSILIAEDPKMKPFIHSMRKNIAESLETSINKISIKATTNEKLGFTGRKEGIAAQAVVLLEKMD